ncbi:MAG: helix-turn-helix domain-containing protein [Planctomycetota bacterium]|nr:helix-turn-helix domain-containing protein [Planctomycetota bacterium]
MPDTATPAAPLLMSIRDCAKALALCEKSVWQLTRDGRLPVIRIGRAVRYSREDILAFIEASKQGPPVTAAMDTAGPDRQKALAAVSGGRQ